jgi:hypothetical protein
VYKQGERDQSFAELVKESRSGLEMLLKSQVLFDGSESAFDMYRYSAVNSQRAELLVCIKQAYRQAKESVIAE